MRRVAALTILCLMVLQSGALGAPGGAGAPGLPPMARAILHGGGGAGVTPADPAHQVVSVSLPDDGTLAVAALGSDPEAVDLYTHAICNLADWTQGMAWGEILWYREEVDFTQEGWTWVEGWVFLPLGYARRGDRPTVRQRLLVYDPAKTGVETLVSAHTMALNRHIIPLGMEGLEEMMDNYAVSEGAFTLLEEGGEDYTFHLPITWDAGRIDVNTVGSYQPFTGLPDYFTLSPAARQKMSVHVMDPETVDLRAWSADGFGVITIQWLYHVRRPTLWVSVDGGPWGPAETLKDYQVDASQAPYGFSEDGVGGGYYGLQILENNLVLGHTYEFQVRYEAGGCSVNSFLLDLTERYGPSFGNGGGSRGGGDREETDLPPAQSGGAGETATVPGEAVLQSQAPQGKRALSDPLRRTDGTEAMAKLGQTAPAPQTIPAGEGPRGGGDLAVVIGVGALCALGTAVLWRLAVRRLVRPR